MRTTLLVLLLLASSASAQSLDEILAKNLAARGGADKLRAIQTIRFTGHAQLGGGDFGYEAQWASIQKRPGMVRSEMTLQGLTQVSAYDGKRGWRMRPFGGRREP